MITPDNKIQSIFEELKLKGHIQSKRKIKSSKFAINFKAGLLFYNTIFYNPKLSNMNEENIRFCLLHEEGHKINNQYGTPCVIIFIITASIPLIINWLLSGNNLIISIAIICYSLLFIFSSIKIFNEPLRWDELQSDIFAATILRDSYNVKKPSETLYNTFLEIDSILKSSSENNNSLITRFAFEITFYHPTDEKRIKNIRTFVDER